MGHESEAVTNRVYAHLRKRDYSEHRAAFSAHIAAQSVAVAPVQIIGSQDGGVRRRITSSNRTPFTFEFTRLTALRPSS